MFHLKKTEYIKDILKIGFPLLAGNLSFYLLQLGDTIMVGRLGTSPLAAIAISGLFSGILMTFVWPVSVGVQALSSRRYGRYLRELSKSDVKTVEMAKFTGNTLDNGIVVGIVMGLVAFFFSFTAREILTLLIKNSPLIPLSLTYIGIIRWGLPFGGILMAIIGFLGGVNKTKYVMIANMGGSLLNIGLNYIFIFGKIAWIPAMGIAGAAVGTVISEILQMIFLLYCVVIKDDFKFYNTLKFKKIQITIMSDMMKVFLPLVVQNIFALSIILVYESIVSMIGTVYLASTHIVFSVFRINKTIVGGFARGSAILVGNALGGGNPEKAVEIVHNALIMTGLIGFVIFNMVVFFPSLIVSIFTLNPEVLSVGIKGMHLFAGFYFVEVLGYTLEIIFGGIGWGKFVLFSESTTNIIFIIGTTLLLIKEFPGLGVYGAWIGFALYQIGHASILFSGYKSKRWLEIEVEKK